MINFLSLVAFIPMLTPLGVNNLKDTISPSYIVKENETFKIELLSNPSTGYAWYIAKKEGGSNVDSVGHNYETSAVGMPSFGGREVFEFKAISKGTAKVTLYYMRPWEKGKPAQVKDIIVEVD
jgi:predicted secreted protein